MVEGHGTAPGEPMSSHRAEAFGKLSWIISLHHVTLFHGIVIKCLIRSYCDNKSIVDTTKTSDLYNRMTTTLCPNFDVLRTIAIKQQQLTSSTTRYENTLYVKAHQDGKKAFQELSIEEKQNVRADELVTQALSNYNPTIKNTILPLGMAYLRINDNMQSSDEQKTLRWRLSEFNLPEYYSEKLEIKVQNLNTIIWAALQIAREKLTPGQRTSSVKQAIGWLATGNRMQIQGRILSPCILCGLDENNDHIYQCRKRSDKIQLVAEAFKKFLSELQTNENVSNALMKGFQNWALQYINNPAIVKALQEQEEIGWNMLVHGFLANSWSIIQELSPENSNNCMGDVWCSKICLWWIQASHNLWIERNKTLHEADKDTWKDKDTREQVQRLYSAAPYMDAEDRKIFNVPLERKLTLPTESLQTWVTTMEPIVKICIKKQETRILNQHGDIRSYFNKQGYISQDETQSENNINP